MSLDTLSISIIAIEYLLCFNKTKVLITVIFILDLLLYHVNCRSNSFLFELYEHGINLREQDVLSRRSSSVV